ncbi:hypothetical protein [Rhodobacter ferrooxidans]|uniref:C-type lysozyme inhibitor domain-containing protein n=1 Tax=Rhodobacter ferrooxidans TaxID=371731 RepID=C8S422_9RHOB|nr:hypothetical protein [Rhodobacter sp. SW2]EEW24284.1 conserved hypothetical protein [Rhodobacter sp. SW2]
MRTILLSSALVLITPAAALAKVPFFNATCGGGIEVHADEGGPVYINGKEAKLKMVGDAYEAKLGNDSIDFFTNPDGTVTASWTGKHGANGICQVDE